MVRNKANSSGLPAYAISRVAVKIAGDIVLAPKPGDVLRKWREIYGLSSSELASLMNVSPSVITDYERGRRNPGRQYIIQFIKSLLLFDRQRNWARTRWLARTLNIHIEGILDIGEFIEELSLEHLLNITGGILLTPYIEHRPIKGYTILESITLIETLAGNEYVRIYGATTDRVLVFTRLTRGRSPLVAVRIAPTKPSVIVLHGIKKVDPLAIRIATKENIPLILSPYKKIDEIIRGLRKYTIFKLLGETIRIE